MFTVLVSREAREYLSLSLLNWLEAKGKNSNRSQAEGKSMKADDMILRDLVALHVNTTSNFRRVGHAQISGRAILFSLVAGLVALGTTAAVASYWV